MPNLRFDAVELAYGDGRPVLSDLSFDLTPGWIGVVGDNGAGKTTLLRGLTQDLAPRAGQVHRCIDVIAFVEQGVHEPAAAVRTFAEDWTKLALRWRARLGLSDEGVSRWSTLSEGQRKRWQIAAALATRPDLLVLDEPSNHLDPDARQVLVHALRAFEGIGVLVSHDRGLLEALTDRTLFVEAGTARKYNCTYRLAREAHHAERAAAARARADKREAARVSRTRIHAAQQKVAAAAHSRSSRARMKSVKDRAAASVGEKSRAAKAEAALSRRASAMRTKADEAQAALDALSFTRDKGTCIQLEPSKSGPRTLVRVTGEPLRAPGAGHVQLVARLELHLERGQRVHLAGPNGAGKSTLLKLLRDRCRGASVLVRQDRPPEQAQATIDAVRSMPVEARGRVLQLAAALGADPAALLDGRPLTPGQAQKLALASALGQPYDLVLLDEPTSHLDLPAVERMQDALTRFEGTLVLITHDLELAAAGTDITWRLCEGELRAEASDLEVHRDHL